MSAWGSYTNLLELALQKSKHLIDAWEGLCSRTRLSYYNAGATSLKLTYLQGQKPGSGVCKKTLPPHDKRSLNITFPHTPFFNDGSKKECWKACKKNARPCFATSTHLLRCHHWRGVVGGQANKIFFGRERYFCTPRNQNLFLILFVREYWSLIWSS